jgi:endonuclease/exonuclease/phosphatase family metal-dependent hydrolase
MTRTLSLAAVGGLSLVAIVAFAWWAAAPALPRAQLERQTTHAPSSASTEQDTFTVVSYNLGHLDGGAEGGASSGAGSEALDRALSLLREVRPDFVALQEVDLREERSVLDSIATQLGAATSAQAVRWNDRYVPSLFSRTGGGAVVSGQAFLSRFPVRRHTRRPIARDSASVWRTLFGPEPVVQVAVVGIGGWPLVVMNVNLDAEAPPARRRQARAVNRLHNRLSRRGFPILLLGSITSPPSSVGPAAPSTDETMATLLRGTSLQPAIHAESALVTGRSVATYPAHDPARKVDHIFYRPRLVVPIDAEIRCGDAPPPSDHCAVSLSFLLPRPVDRLPEKRIPESRLPSLDSLLGPMPGG